MGQARFGITRNREIYEAGSRQPRMIELHKRSHGNLSLAVKPCPRKRGGESERKTRVAREKGYETNATRPKPRRHRVRYSAHDSTAFSSSLTTPSDSCASHRKHGRNDSQVGAVGWMRKRIKAPRIVCGFSQSRLLAHPLSSSSPITIQVGLDEERREAGGVGDNASMLLLHRSTFTSARHGDGGQAQCPWAGS